MAKSSATNQPADKTGPAVTLRNGDAGASYLQHLTCDRIVTMEGASQRDRFDAVSRTLRDMLAERWIKTQQTHDRWRS